MEDLLAKHRKEQRDLQARITQKKKAASKKTRKGVNDECAHWEEELKATHAAETAALNGDSGPSEEREIHVEEQSAEEDANGATETFSNHRTSTVNHSAVPPEDSGPGSAKKPNRQKARLARRAAEIAETSAKAEEEAKNQPDPRAKEREAMLAAFKARGLKEKEVRADGHCLYSAVADQLVLHDIGLRPRIYPTITGDGNEKSTEPFRIVRRTTAEYIKAHKDEFEPFLEEPLDDYVRKVGETGEWGGQLELRALAEAYGVRISVLDGNGSVHEIEAEGLEKNEATQIWLAYYRYGFGLGEHYNSLRKG
ncbi:cysteine proteinase [Tothia fuscella]|uniref:Cysteine proteinase n=1 Tax=Tothia fuscella TaxID=1048955 RepID=A0A9P4P2A6_9PEZI|nr:cysteine proteinase [Tothia fuscella]